MQSLKQQIADDFNIEPWQVDKTFKQFDIKIIEKAYRSTQNSNEGNRKYFKEALLFYKNQKKSNPTIMEIKPSVLSRSKFEDLKKTLKISR